MRRFFPVAVAFVFLFFVFTSQSLSPLEDLDKKCSNGMGLKNAMCALLPESVDLSDILRLGDTGENKKRNGKNDTNRSTYSKKFKQAHRVHYEK